VKGRVVLYADASTKSLEKAINETNRRRAIQVAYNTEHNITPRTVIKAIKDITEQIASDHDKAIHQLLTIDAELYAQNPKKFIKEKKLQMDEAVQILDFETAALIRDEIEAITSATKVKKEKKPTR
jgi:excinuclease ABC subunit B